MFDDDYSTEYDKFDAAIDTMWGYARLLPDRVQRGEVVPRDELEVFLRATDRAADDVRASSLQPIDKRELSRSVELGRAWLWFLHTHGETISALTPAACQRILSTAPPTDLEGRVSHFAELLMVLCRARRNERFWEAARAVGTLLRQDAHDHRDSAAFQALWAVHRFLVPGRLLAEYEPPPPMNTRVIVTGVTSAGLPGLGRRR